MDAENDTSCTLSFFAEADEVIGIVHDVVRRDADVATKITTFQRRLSIYQEHAELLDPHLEAIVTPLTTALVDAAHQGKDDDHEYITHVCILLQCLSHVRGHKSVVKFYPVDVKGFMPILTLLTQFRSMKGEGVWQTQCQLMLWLSSLALIPFDLKSLDTEGPSVVERIVDMGNRFLHEAGTVREFACILLYRLLTRPDLKDALEAFLSGGLETMRKVDEGGDVLYVTGVIQALSFVFKHGERSALLSHAHQFWPVASSLMQSTTVQGSLLLRKLGMKLVQRLALTLLAPITPKWRYTQKTTHLGLAPKKDLAPEDDDEEEADYDIPEEVEDVIQVLLTGVADKDTNVRWTASKGIGRICARLPKELADEVLSYILELFSESAEDASWHGACLSVAELARRGLLLPESIPALVPLIEKALVYDINRGSYSIGANVRDSACYVCWACARSFDAEIMAPFMPQLSPVLMTTACLDREVNCRRAAAAAFQECVGRVGNVPEGMAILECADYFTLSKRPHAYLVVSPAVAQFGAYGFDFIAHLLHTKVGHWDVSLRQLTADALAKLVHIDMEFFACDALDRLLGWSVDNNLDLRHGSCLSLASIVQALIEKDFEIPEDRLKAVANIVVKIEKARLYRGKGGSLMRQAVSHIIASIAQSHLTRSLKHRLRLLTTVNESIGHPKPEVPPDALKALYALSREFAADEIEDATAATTKIYLGHLSSENVAFRRGYTLAMGRLPKALLLPETHECIDALRKATEIEAKEEDRDAESRANAVKALTNVVCEMHNDPSCIEEAEVEYLKEVMETLFACMEDYSTDRRGDVGSWIREAAMHGLHRVLVFLSRAVHIDASLVARVVSYLMRNAVERISSIRQVAVQIFLSLMEEPTLTIPHKETLNKIRMVDEDVSVAFGTSKGVEAMVPFLELDVYRVALLEGLTASIGGLEKSLSHAVVVKLIGFLHSLDDERFHDFMELLMSLSAKYNRSMRMATPVLMTIDAICKHPDLFVRIADQHKSQVLHLVCILTVSMTSLFD